MTPEEPTRARDDAPMTPATAPQAHRSGRSGVGTSAAVDLIPGWLALLVLILLLGVAALGGYVIRGALIAPRTSAPTEYAVEDLERSVASDPDDPEALVALGYAYQIEGRYDEAMAAYDSALKIDPDNGGALFNKGVVLMETDRPKEGEAALWRVLESQPDHVLAAKALGEYYIGMNQYKSALVALEPVAKAHPEYADLQYLAGYACEQLGIATTAVDYYRGALKFNPGYSEAREGLQRLGAEEETP